MKDFIIGCGRVRQYRRVAIVLNKYYIADHVRTSFTEASLSKTNTGELQDITEMNSKTWYPIKDTLKKEEWILNGYKYQNLSLPYEESFDEGDETPLDMSVVVDPY